MSSEDVEDAARSSVLFPLTARTKLAQEYRDRLEKAWKKRAKCETERKQMKSVGVIKEHIAEQKRTYLCHHTERIEKQNRQRLELEEKILAKYNVHVPISGRRRIADKLLNHTRAQRLKWWKQNERITNISRKLAIETEMKQKESLAKIIRPKTKKLVPKISKVLSYIDAYIECEKNIVHEDIQEVKKEEIIEEWEDIKEEPLTKTPKKATERKSKKDIRKKSKIKKSKTIADEEIEEAKEILPDLKDIREKTEISYPKDYSFISKPHLILFNDFANNKKYKQKITMINASSDILYCKFEKLQSNTKMVSQYIQIKHMPYQKVFPAKFFNFAIYFHPRNIKCLEGNVIFLVRKTTADNTKQFEIPFKCERSISDINVTPVNVVFNSIPIWEVEKILNNYDKVIKIENNLLNDSILIIRKAEDEFEQKYRSIDLEQVLPQPPDEEKIVGKKDKRRKTKKKSEIINLEDEKRKIAESVAQYIMQECIENIDNNFCFEKYFVEIQSNKNIQLKICFKNVTRFGIYQEKYRFEFLEKSGNEFDRIKIQDILVQGEVTDKFIQTENNYIDFHICIMNSVYQQSFIVFNAEYFAVKLRIQLPGQLKEYFSIYPRIFHLKAKSSETIFIRFIPRKDILNTNIKYYDPHTSILNFPMKICLLPYKEINIPPTILTVYAILTEPDALKLYLKDDSIQEEENGIPVINIGQVTTHETITIDFQIKNLSAIVQDFGFMNIPEFLTISPNYGFGTIEPNETKYLKLHISPIIKDITNLYPGNNQIDSIDVITKLTCTTVYQNSGIKEDKMNITIPNAKEEFEEKYDYKFQFDTVTSDNIDNLEGSEENLLDLFIKSQESVQKPKISNHLKHDEKNMSILVMATFTDYWTELSHQYVIFPDTPVGSYTTIDIKISAINNASQSECRCGFAKKKRSFHFGCHFEIFGGCDDITIEPICGDLVYGQSKKLTIIAKPVIENHLLQETAKSYKLQRLEANKRPKKKAKKSIRTENLGSISLQNFDIYAAEKQLWKTMKPHTIKTLFTFVVTFDSDLNKKPEILYLTTECKIVRPDFITNTETQCINFGPTAMFTRPKKIIQIDNISKQIISPDISIPSPVGPFSCSIPREIKLEKEHILKIPLTFAPDKETNFKEYLEIKSGHTVERLIIAGNGISPEYEFSPKFTVCRIEATLDKFSDCVFQINNKSEAPLIIEFTKICELKGIIQKKPQTINELIDKVNGNEKGKGKFKSSAKGKDQSVKSNKTDKKQKRDEKKEKVKKFSENLTVDEEYSIDNFFEVYKGESQFKIMNSKNNEIVIEPLGKSKIKIRFEFPKPPKENIKKGTNDKLKESDKKSKSNKTESAKSGKISKINKKDEDASYVAKYNLLLGGIVLIKDLIIIAKFK